MSFYILRGRCRIRISFYFFALLCVLSLFDRRGVLLPGLVAALLHECGHLALMLLIPGHSPREIDVTPFGLRIGNSPLAEFAGGNGKILAAGCGVNFICAAATFGFLPDFAAVSFLMGVSLPPALPRSGRKQSAAGGDSRLAAVALRDGGRRGVCARRHGVQFYAAGGCGGSRRRRERERLVVSVVAGSG